MVQKWKYLFSFISVTVHFWIVVFHWKIHRQSIDIDTQKRKTEILYVFIDLNLMSITIWVVHFHFSTWICSGSSLTIKKQFFPKNHRIFSIVLCIIIIIHNTCNGIPKPNFVFFISVFSFDIFIQILTDPLFGSFQMKGLFIYVC